MGPDGCDYYNIDSDNGIIITERVNGINNSVKNIKDCINLTEEIKCENVSLIIKKYILFDSMNFIINSIVK
jgi:hypothetical protein